MALKLRRLGSILSCVLIERELTVLMASSMRIKLWSGEACFPFAQRVALMVLFLLFEQGEGMAVLMRGGSNELD